MKVEATPGGWPDGIGTVEEGPLASRPAALARDDPQGLMAALDGRLPRGRPGSPAALRQQVGERLAVALTWLQDAERAATAQLVGLPRKR